MANLDVKKTAKVIALIFSAMSVVWGFIIGIGGQQVLNRLMTMHFISATISAQPFLIQTFIVSVLYHLILGAVLGAFFATVWNYLNKK